MLPMQARIIFARPARRSCRPATARCATGPRRPRTNAGTPPPPPPRRNERTRAEKTPRVHRGRVDERHSSSTPAGTTHHTRHPERSEGSSRMTASAHHLGFFAPLRMTGNGFLSRTRAPGRGHPGKAATRAQTCGHTATTPWRARLPLGRSSKPGLTQRSRPGGSRALHKSPAP